jgi:hypothetical protein
MASTVEVLQVAPDGAASLGTVDIYACQAHSFDPIPTDELAVAMLKAEVAKRGGKYIVGMTLARQNIDIERNCYWTIHASGAAFN